MVMPRAKILFTTGCVSEVSATRNRFSLVMYVDATEIRALHPYFATPTSRGTVADDILFEGASTSVENFNDNVDVPVVIRKPFGLHTFHGIYRIKKDGKDPSELQKFPHAMEPGYYYWTRLARRPTARKSKKRTKPKNK